MTLRDSRINAHRRGFRGAAGGRSSARKRAASRGARAEKANLKGALTRAAVPNGRFSSERGRGRRRARPGRSRQPAAAHVAGPALHRSHLAEDQQS